MTTKEQLHAEFDEKFVETLAPTGTRAVQSSAEEIETFLDQAYDRIREEASQEVWAVVNKMVEGTIKDFDEIDKKSVAAIQSLITKK